VGERISHNERLPAKIAISHGLRRHRILNGGSARELKSFVGSVKERFVVAVVQMRDDNRTARCYSEIVADFCGFSVCPYAVASKALFW
jgi:hypothetical protein